MYGIVLFSVPNIPVGLGNNQQIVHTFTIRPTKADGIGLSNLWFAVEKFGMNESTELTSVPAGPFGVSHFGDVIPNHANKLI